VAAATVVTLDVVVDDLRRAPVLQDRPVAAANGAAAVAAGAATSRWAADVGTGDVALPLGDTTIAPRGDRQVAMPGVAAKGCCGDDQIAVAIVGVAAPLVPAATPVAMAWDVAATDAAAN